MATHLQVPTKADPFQATLAPSAPTTFVGANGSGKAWLAVWIEKQVGAKAHRIAAHRSLAREPDVTRVSGGGWAPRIVTEPRNHQFSNKNPSGFYPEEVARRSEIKGRPCRQTVCACNTTRERIGTRL